LILFNPFRRRKMIRRLLVLVASSLAIAAGSVVFLTSSVFASASFTPTTGIVPGTSFDYITITAEPGNFLCERLEGEETFDTVSVIFGMYFVSSGDTVVDEGDDFLGRVEGTEIFSYESGWTTSPPFGLVMPTLEPHNPANFILAVPFCFDLSTQEAVDQGSVVIGYSDGTMDEDEDLAPTGASDTVALGAMLVAVLSGAAAVVVRRRRATN
jgi:hypothetical protein